MIALPENIVRYQAYYPHPRSRQLENGQAFWDRPGPAVVLSMQNEPAPQHPGLPGMAGAAWPGTA
jgi:hypothetical protein